MTTETTLLLMILTGLVFASPGALALWRNKGSRTSILAAEQLEAQLTARLNNMHTRIMALEEDNARKDKRIDDMQARNDQQDIKLATLEKQNVILVSWVRRLIAQLERHELKPEVDNGDLNRLLS